MLNESLSADYLVSKTKQKHRFPWEPQRPMTPPRLTPLKAFYYISVLCVLYVCGCVYTAMHMALRGQLAAVSSLLPLRGTQGLNSGL